MLEASLRHCMSPSSLWRTILWQMMNSEGSLQLRKHNTWMLKVYLDVESRLYIECLIKMISGNSQHLTSLTASEQQKG